MNCLLFFMSILTRHLQKVVLLINNLIMSKLIIIYYNYYDIYILIDISLIYQTKKKYTRYIL